MGRRVALMVLMVTAGLGLAGIYNAQWELDRYRRDATTVEAQQMRILRASAMARHITSRLKQADESIDIAVYTVTTPKHPTTKSLLTILQERSDNGVRVRMVLDGGQGGAIAFASEARKRGIPVKLDHRSAGSMHHKFAVIDGDEVYNGSANWTVTAFSRDDETTIYANSQELAKPFNRRFQDLWQSIQE